MKDRFSDKVISQILLELNKLKKKFSIKNLLFVTSDEYDETGAYGLVIPYADHPLPYASMLKRAYDKFIKNSTTQNMLSEYQNSEDEQCITIAKQFLLIKTLFDDIDSQFKVLNEKLKKNRM